MKVIGRYGHSSIQSFMSHLVQHTLSCEKGGQDAVTSSLISGVLARWSTKVKEEGRDGCHQDELVSVLLSLGSA